MDGSGAMVRAALAAVLAAGPVLAQEAPPPGLYHIDPSHTRVLVDVDHLGLSRYLFMLPRTSGTLTFDPQNPAAMTLQAEVDMAAVATLHPDPATDFDAMLRGADFLDAGTHPTATFVSTAIAPTGPDSATVTGDLTFRGVTRPLVLTVRYNGGYGPQAFDPGGARIGFSAETVLNRSDWGMGYGIPAPGTTLGVADAVRVRIEAELTSLPMAFGN